MVGFCIALLREDIKNGRTLLALGRLIANYFRNSCIKSVNSVGFSISGI